EIAVVIAKGAAGGVGVAVDLEIVVAIQGAVEIGVAAPGVHDQHVGGVDADAGEKSAGVASLVGARRRKRCENIRRNGAGERSDDPAPAPGAARVTGLNQATDAGVRA